MTDNQVTSFDDPEFMGDNIRKFVTKYSSHATKLKERNGILHSANLGLAVFSQECDSNSDFPNNHVQM